MINMKKIWSYIISVIIALGVGGLSALLSMDGMEQYASLQKPPLSPPAFVFGIVWTILFILMGISAAMIYNSNSQKKKQALIVYAAQLVVNFFWSIIFFNRQAYLFAFFWILLLILIVVVMMSKFFDIKPKAAYLQIPYLVWLCFAAYLNIMVYILNR